MVVGVAPKVSSDLLEEKVRRIFFETERSSAAALLYCRGAAGSVDNVDIVPTTCEFELRREMARRHKTGRRVAYLVDWLDPDQVPLDLRARVAERKVYLIRREEQLAYALGAKRIAADLRGSKLAQLALREGFERLRPSPVLTLDLERAASAWLGRQLQGLWSWEWPDLGDFISALATHGASGTQPGQRAGTNGLLQDVLDEVQQVAWGQFRAVGEVAFAAWRVGEIKDLLPVLVMLDALEVGEPDKFARTLVHKEIVRRYPSWGELACRDDWRDCGADLELLDKKTMQDRPGELARRLDQLVAGTGHPELFARSVWMREGRLAREREFGESLSALSREPAGRADAAWGQLQAMGTDLLTHRSFATTQDEQTQVEMVLRLAAAWCGEDGAAVSATDGMSGALAVAQEYAAIGGYRDWSRRVVRHARHGAWTEPMQQGLADLLRVSDQREDERDRRFAEGMRLYAAEGRPARGVVPIEKAAKQLVAGYLGGSEDEGPTRRLLVLLMDGMSWHRCRELLESLAQRQWSPLQWRPKGYKGQAMPAMLAAFPTITAVSRSAFFAGEVPASGKMPSSSGDPKRWKENPALKIYADHGLPLFLKDKIEQPTGLDKEVAKKIKAEDLPLVAAVINTYDDLLKAGRSVEVDLDEITLKPLLQMLRAANEARRAVLLVADHGHVSGERLEAVPGGSADGGARWRPVSLQGEERSPDEVEMAGPGVWAPVAGQPIAMLRGETSRYTVHSAQGEHGGLSLQEVVSPAILIGHTDLADSEAGDDLRDDVPTKPSWWDWRSWQLRAAVTPKPARRPVVQTLFPDAVPAETTQPETAGVVAWIEELVKSDAFKTALKIAAPAENVRQKIPAQVRQLLQLLEHRGGRAPYTAVAQCLGVSERRVTGALTRLQSALTHDGYRCLDLETETRSVKLDRSLLSMTFGVEVPE